MKKFTLAILLILFFAVAAIAKMNINTASPEELEILPGIGPKKAADIEEYRKKNGKFKTIEELVNVKGIGEKSLEKLKPEITVGE